MATVLAAVLVAPLAAESRPELLKGATIISNDAMAREFVDFYYLHPSPDLTLSALQFFARNHALESEALEAPFSGFLSQLFKQNPKVAEQCAREITSIPGRRMLVYSIWISGIDAAPDLLDIVAKGAPQEIKDLVKNFTYQVPPDMLRDPIRSGGAINALWGAFFATGDRRYVEKIVSVLPWAEDKEDGVRGALGNSAGLSLISNASRHKTVREILQQDAQTAPEEQRRFVAAVLKQADEKSQ